MNKVNERASSRIIVSSYSQSDEGKSLPDYSSPFPGRATPKAPPTDTSAAVLVLIFSAILNPSKANEKDTIIKG